MDKCHNILVLSTFTGIHSSFPTIVFPWKSIIQDSDLKALNMLFEQNDKCFVQSIVFASQAAALQTAITKPNSSTKVHPQNSNPKGYLCMANPLKP